MIRRLLSLPALTLAVSLTLLAGPAGAQPTSPVSVYPSPGTSYNQPHEQIVFRGIPAGEIGSVSVVGSLSGTHTGQIEADSDGDGASFVPDQPFQNGETVTVSTSLNIIGGQNGTFTFQIEHPSWPIKPGPLPVVPNGPGAVQHFPSRPDLLPPALWVSKDTAPSSEGDIFVAPQFGPVQNGPMILDSTGRLVWFDPFPVTEKELVTDFRVQNLYGQPVLTWFQGYTNDGTGEGEGVILNQSYQQVATVQAAYGLQMDLHEFLVTPQGDAYIMAVSPVNEPAIVHKPLLDTVIQEIDIKTGLVLFEWHALDHIPLRYSDFVPKTPGFVFDPYHGNSIGVDSDGNLIVSMRNTSAVYKINHSTGQIMWELGGKNSSFRMGTGTSTAFQHNAVVQPDGTITIFDDGAGPPILHQYSRGIRVALNTTRMTATLVNAYPHAPQVSANFEGSVQNLAGGDVFLGWGQQPFFSEDNASGRQIFDAHFVEPTASYRAYRFPWSAQPVSPPALAQGWGPGETPELYASWNGATDVASWRVLAGTSANSLTAVGQVRRNGFETAIPASTEAPYLEVQPLDSSGNNLAGSNEVSLPRHVEVYGSSAFVTRASGFGGLPVGCFTGAACALTTTISAGGSVLASTGPERIPAGGTGLVYFHLSGAAGKTLARAGSNRLPVTVTVKDTASRVQVTSFINLVAFATSGPGPRRSIATARELSLVGGSDFVNSRGTGGLLAACHASVAPCSVRATLTVGRTVIASTGPERLGAGELGYVIFSLTATGRSMLAHAGGNQLAAGVRLTGAGQTASGQLALVRFS